jgi:epoxyqueuosine reductase QueG
MSGNLRLNPKAVKKSAVKILKQIALENRCASCGIAGVQLPSETLNRFNLATQNLPLNLSYLLKESHKRMDIRNWFPEAKSVLICSFQYWNSNLDDNQCIFKIGDCENFLKQTGRKFFHGQLLEYLKNMQINPKISRYALSFDYHKILKKILKKILENIKKEFPLVDGKIFADTSPVMEKEFARLSGIGWQGKNTLIISKTQGSYFFLGGIALSIKLKPDEILKNECNDCSICIDVCPTKALKEPGILNPNLCISYWTTQNKTHVPKEILNKIRGYVYGCDLCQQACPYNKNTSNPILKELTPIKITQMLQ